MAFKLVQFRFGIINYGDLGCGFFTLLVQFIFLYSLDTFLSNRFDSVTVNYNESTRSDCTINVACS